MPMICFSFACHAEMVKREVQRSPTAVTVTVTHHLQCKWYFILFPFIYLLFINSWDVTFTFGIAYKMWMLRRRRKRVAKNKLINYRNQFVLTCANSFTLGVFCLFVTLLFSVLSFVFFFLLLVLRCVQFRRHFYRSRRRLRILVSSRFHSATIHEFLPYLYTLFPFFA